MPLDLPEIGQPNWGPTLNAALAALEAADATAASTASATYSPLFDAIVAPAATGVAATDTATLQALIDAAPLGAVILLRPERYQLNAPLLLARDVTLRGLWVRERLGSKAGSLPDVPRGAPHLEGSVLVQTAAAQDVIQITSGASAHLQTLGLLFEGAHRFVNTGHGVNVIPEVDAINGFGNGMTDAKWKNLKVFGHDGNHYAFNVVNPMHCVLEDIRSWGGGVLRMATIGTKFNYGNTVVIAPYGYMFCGGTADAFHLSAEAVSGDGAMNFVTYIRPQCNVVQLTEFSPVVPTSDQWLWREVNTGSTTQVKDICAVCPDFESSSGAAHIVRPGTLTAFIGGGYLPNETPFRQRLRYNRFNPPTVAVNASGAGAGNGATATLIGTNAADSMAGVVQITMGSATAAQARLATVTLTAPLATVPKFVQLTFLGGGTDVGFYPQNSTATSFEIRARTAPVIGGTYQIGWRIVE